MLVVRRALTCPHGAGQRFAVFIGRLRETILRFVFPSLRFQFRKAYYSLSVLGFEMRVCHGDEKLGMFNRFA